MIGDLDFGSNVFYPIVFALGVVCLLAAFTVLGAPIYIVIQKQFQSTGFQKHFGTLWRQGALLVLCMLTAGIVWGLNHAQHGNRTVQVPITKHNL